MSTTFQPYKLLEGELMAYFGLPSEQAGAAALSLSAFVNYTSQIELEDWQRVMAARLEKLAYQTGQRLLLHGPPQFGKSIIVSQRFPSWILGRDPKHRVRLACYNQTHATRFSKVNLEIMRSPEYLAAFPNPETRVPAVCLADEWSTGARARLNDAQPSFVALGLGSGFTGLGADTLIVDDPYKNREEAFSSIINEGIWGWWREVVVPRLNTDSNVVVMFHRWKTDDLAGKLLEQGGWEHLRFAAIGDGVDDPMEREVGFPLSTRYPVEYLRQVELTQGSAAFASLYQGVPVAREGNMFKWSWFEPNNIVEALPTEGLTFIRYWDKAFTEGGGAYTAGVLMAKHRSGAYYVIDVVRGQWESGSRDAEILRTAQEDSRRCRGVKQWIEQEPGSTGRDSCAVLIQKLAGYSVEADKVTGSKEERADPLASQAQAGNIKILRAPWLRTFLEELTAFPNGKYKDQVDAASGAFNKLALHVTASTPAVAGTRRTSDFGMI
ncbi:MAG: phage terminase large subunit [Pyrinomonadaceae bacterium]